MKLSCLVAATFVALISIASRNANATTGLWSTNGAGCMPDDESIQNNLYGYSSGAIGFKSDFLLPLAIRVFCPVNMTPTSSLTQFRMVYSSAGSGPTATGVVSMRLFRVSKATGSIQTVFSFASNGTDQFGANCPSGPNVNCTSHGFTHTYDFVNFMYYVEVDLAMSSPVLLTMLNFLNLSLYQ
jgi:hypothetical protein